MENKYFDDKGQLGVSLFSSDRKRPNIVQLKIPGLCEKGIRAGQNDGTFGRGNEGVDGTVEALVNVVKDDVDVLEENDSRLVQFCHGGRLPGRENRILFSGFLPFLDSFILLFLVTLPDVVTLSGFAEV